MDTTYRLTQTGKQVQDLLDQVTPNEVAIAAETARATDAEQALQGDLSAETTRAEGAEAALQNNINSEESARIAADSVLQGKIDDEESRAQAAEQAIQGDLADETTRATGAETTLQGNIDAEASARQSADQVLQGSIDAEATARQNADSTLQGNIDAEEARARAAEQANATAIAGIEAKIPADASAQNQLADKSFVNSSVATATATFKGTYNLVNDLHLNVGATRAQIIAELNATIQNADNNDYCFVQIPVATSKPTEIAAVDRYKFNGNTWAFEYSLNNSGYTEAQWDAINSGITSGLVSKLNALPTNADLVNLLAGKQDVLTFDSTPTANSNNPVTSQGIKAAIDAASGGSTFALDEEIERATAAEQALQNELDAEETARQNADTTLQGNIDAEETRARAAEQANATAIAGIEAKIPSEASAQNQLADKSFVNSSVATATATFRGTYNEVTDLHLTTAATRANIATALASTIQNADNNDYCFVQIPTADATPTVIARVERYKFDGTSWAFEYELNNSGFTQAQWDAINSTITSGLVAKLNDLPTNSELTTLLAGKQDVIADLPTIRSGAAAGATAYQLPGTGVPKSDLSQGVQDSLDAADAAAPQSTTYTKTEVDGLLDAEELARQNADTTLQGNIDAEELARQNADTTLQGNIDAEETRAKASEQANADDIDVIEAKIPSAATSQNQLADKAYVDAGLAGKQGTLTFDQTPTANSNNPVTSTGIKGYVDTAVGDEETRARAAEQVNALVIDDVEALIPTQASAQNQLADKAFVNSSIATNTGDFVGTYNSLAELQADNPNPNNNDYGYVVSTDQQGNQSYSRYKYSSSSQTWEFEYALNNSSFTADEWAAIQSGITAALVGKLGDLYTKAQLDVILDSKQSALTFDNVPTAGSDNPVKSGGIYNALDVKADKVASATNGDFAGLDGNGNLVDSGSKASDFATAAQGLLADTAYQKPSTGIPSTDLASGVNTSLGKADTAYQKPSTGIPETDLDAATQQKINTAVDISGKADKVSGATENDFAGLDANGNLKDSGKKASDFATAAQGALADTAYQKPQGGIPDTDLSAAVQTSLGKADTAIQDVSGKADKVSGATENDFAGLDANGNLKDSGKKASDFATAAQGALADTAYQKPQGGIPDTDLSAAVQTSLGKADTAIQDVSGKADKVANATENDFAGLDANGNLKDSGKKASDFATAAQGALADTAYQLPQGGIPSTDLASGVQTDLGKASTAYQKPSGGIPSSDMASAVQTSLGKADTAYQKPSGGIPSSDMASEVQTSLGKADTALQSVKMSDVADLSVVALTADVSSSCSITGAANAGKSQTIIYTNASGSDKVVTVPTTYTTPDGAAIELTCPNGGYVEVNYLNINGTVYARGL